MFKVARFVPTVVKNGGEKTTLMVRLPFAGTVLVPVFHRTVPIIVLNMEALVPMMVLVMFTGEPKLLVTTTCLIAELLRSTVPKSKLLGATVIPPPGAPPVISSAPMSTGAVLVSPS